MFESKLKLFIAQILTELGMGDVMFVVERPAEMAHGDYATNVAMAGAKKAGKNPRALAEEIKAKLEAIHDEDILAVEIAGPGFINIRCAKGYFVRELDAALDAGEMYGNNETLKGKKVVIEYTDPNPFKEFHIGHLMSNTIGESISRTIEASGAEVKRACYQGDVGLHVAKAVWGFKHHISDVPDMLVRVAEDVGSLYSGWSAEMKKEIFSGIYARGTKEFEINESSKKEIFEINQKLYSKTDEFINTLYSFGKEWSLSEFEKIFKRLDTKFDYYFFESNTGTFGKEIVEKYPDIFKKSDGAIVYKGDEAKGLHTRVFINKEGLPTYEAKELGLAKIKYDTYPYDISIVITGNEVNDYFKVLLDAMSKVFPELAMKTIHVSHGMLRLPTGKMSSRTGDVITAESLISDTKERARAKNTDEKFSENEKDQIAEQVAIGAIKYSILRQASGKDIIFDFEQSLSFEGDSGPYLQYTHARTKSLLAKAGDQNVAAGTIEGETISTLHKYILRFPEVVLRAEQERAPHYIATYLIELAREFNSFYANTIILDGSSDEEYKIALTQMTSRILKRGLWLLGIVAPLRM